MVWRGKMTDLAMPELLKGLPTCCLAKASMRASAAFEQPRLRYVYCEHKNVTCKNRRVGAWEFDCENNAHLWIAPSPFTELDAHVVIINSGHVGHLAARARCLRLQRETPGVNC